MAPAFRAASALGPAAVQRAGRAVWCGMLRDARCGERSGWGVVRRSGHQRRQLAPSLWDGEVWAGAQVRACTASTPGPGGKAPVLRQPPGAMHGGLAGVGRGGGGEGWRSIWLEPTCSGPARAQGAEAKGVWGGKGGRTGKAMLIMPGTPIGRTELPGSRLRHGTRTPAPPSPVGSSRKVLCTKLLMVRRTPATTTTVPMSSCTARMLLPPARMGVTHSSE